MFDANTLEPIVGVPITLLDNKKQKYDTSEHDLINPDISDATGGYSFYVEQGIYYLEIAPPPTFSVVHDVSLISQNYKNIYPNIYYDFVQKDLNPPQTVADAKAGQIVEQAGDVERRDIALSSPSVRTKKPVQVLSHDEQLMDDGYFYSGELSHPLTNILVKQGNTVIQRDAADVDGAYSFIIDPSIIDPQKSITITYQKVDLTKAAITRLPTPFNLLGNVVRPVLTEDQISDTVTIQSQPILRSLSGYAYDAAGNPMPLATVRVHVTGTDIVVTTVQADEAGHFTVPDDMIPKFAYYLEYVDAKTQKVSKKETSDFASANNIVETFDQTLALQNSKKLEAQQAAGAVISQAPQNMTVGTSTSGMNIVILILGTLVLIGTAVGVFFVIKKQQGNGLLQ